MIMFKSRSTRLRATRRNKRITIIGVIALIIAEIIRNLLNIN